MIVNKCTKFENLIHVTYADYDYRLLDRGEVTVHVGFQKLLEVPTLSQDTV
jgi:hypothetical protein